MFENGNSETKNESDNWGEPDPIEQDFTIEEILDMPVMSRDSDKQDNISNIQSHDNSNHGIFCVTDKDVDLIDIEDLY